MIPLSSPFLAAMTALALSLLASPAQAACQAARKAPGVVEQPEPWRRAVDELIRSTAEAGHPWSCAGGEVDLSVGPEGALLRVAREGEAQISRKVASPDDVVPLGQALLARPFEAPAPAPPPTPPAASAPPAAEPPAAPAEPPAGVRPAQPAGKREPRLLVSGGVDGRYVGGPGVAWMGLSLGAAVPMGRWLPQIQLRQQRDLLAGRPHIDEISLAFTMMTRLSLSKAELRAGVRVEGAGVERTLSFERSPSGKRRDQNRLDGRLGGVLSLAVAVVSWGAVVLTADAGAVVASSEEKGPELLPGDSPKEFPSWTAGGAALFEVPL
jgi:hypothetical protein